MNLHAKNRQATLSSYHPKFGNWGLLPNLGSSGAEEEGVSR